MKTIKVNQIFRVSIISMLLFSGVQLSAQESYSIKGYVKNSKAELIKDAAVKLVNPVTYEVVAQGRCKESGEFYIDSAPIGEYNLIVKKNGVFRAKVKRIVINNDGKYFVKNIYENDSIQTPTNLVAVQ